MCYLSCRFAMPQKCFVVLHISAFITSFEALRSGVSEYGFSRTRIFLHKDEIVDSVLIREHTGQRNTIFWHILCSEFLDDALKLNVLTH